MTPKTATTQRAHQRSYETAIRVQAGEAVQVSKRDLWDDVHVWYWCIAEDDGAGWLPEAYLEVTGDSAIALRACTALELTVAAGETVTLLTETGGWYWVENAAGQRGWVPASIF